SAQPFAPTARPFRVRMAVPNDPRSAPRTRHHCARGAPAKELTMTDSTDVVIIGAARTPFARLNGALATLPATALGAHAIAAALAQSGLDGEEVEAVYLGQVLQAGRSEERRVGKERGTRGA